MSSSWGFQQRLIQAQFGNWSIQLDPSRPDQGMLVCSDLFEPLAVWALTPQPPHSLVPEEVYIRQTDLIARFQQTDSDQFSFQVDWRLLPVSAPFLAGVELWISLRDRTARHGSPIHGAIPRLVALDRLDHRATRWRGGARGCSAARSHGRGGLDRRAGQYAVAD